MQDLAFHSLTLTAHGPVLPGVTAVVPVAGRPLLLREALVSILSGTRLPSEIIVVADGQADQRSDDVRAAQSVFAGLDGPVRTRVLPGPGSGPAAARNLGAEAAAGDWLAFLDSDDLWTPEKLELQWEYMRRRPQLNVSQTGERWWKNGRWLKQPARLRPRPGRFLADAWRYCLVSLSSTLIRKESFFAAGAFDPAFPACEDFEFWLRYLLRDPIGLVPDGLVIKRSGGWPQLSAAHSLDALRIRAILKTLGEHALPHAERERARAVCLEKIAILNQGAARRGQPDKFRELERAITACFEA